MAPPPPAPRQAPRTWSRTSWARMIVAPCSYAETPRPRPTPRPFRSRAPVRAPSELLRENPTRIGRPSSASSDRRRTSSKLCAAVLPKPIPGSRQTRSSRTPAATANVEPLLEEALHLRDDVVVRRRDLHRARLALHVHETEVAARVGDDTGQLGVTAQGRDVVHELGAELERTARDRRPSTCRSRPARRQGRRPPARRGAAPLRH